MPGESQEIEIDIYAEFIFPVAGRYKVWIDYATGKRTSIVDKTKLDRVHVISNLVEIEIDRDHASEDIWAGSRRPGE